MGSTVMSENRTDEEIATHAREIRKSIVTMVHAASSGHPGGALGLADIFAVLYFDVLNIDPEDPDRSSRDRLLISNGHVSAVRYAAMAERGYFPKEELLTFRAIGSRLQGHPSTRSMKGLDNSSGSLGQGLSQAVGQVLGARLNGQNHRVFICTSDGEMGEGMSWEAAQAAAHYRAPVVAFMDMNGIQIDGFTKDVLDLRDLGEKFRAFGWSVLETDGHDIPAIREAFRKAMEMADGPVMILFRTILGKGVSFMENNPGWHGKAPSDEELKKALVELEA